MATNQVSCNHGGDEDYIDMEVSSSSSSSSNFLCYSISSPPQSREFEFQMCSLTQDRDSATSPADELFYKGKLLPLHLPPRLLMVQKLLQGSNTTTISTTTSTFEKKTEEPFEENYAIPFIETTNSTSTPLESCNISPSESCRVSSELNPDEYFFEWSTEMSGFIGCDNDDQSKKSWTRKLKQIKKSSLGQKLKASRAYIKSLFSKSACSDDFCAKAACNVGAETISKGNNCLNKYMRVANKTPLRKPDCDRYNMSSPITKTIDKEMADQDDTNSHRRSFSGAIQRHCAIKCSSSSTSSSGSSSSSSSFSFSSNGFYNLQLLKRSSSASLEIESSIEGAIAHCKQSQQLLSSRKAVGESGVCSLLASRMAVCGDQERPGVCSI